MLCARVDAGEFLCMMGCMKRPLTIVLTAWHLIGCPGLAKDINNGAANTERELRGEPRPKTSPALNPIDVDAGPTTVDPDASISI